MGEVKRVLRRKPLMAAMRQNGQEWPASLVVI